MQIGRRALLGGLLALSAVPAAGQLRLLSDSDVVALAARVAAPVAEGRRRVLFVGNSFTYEHDVPTRVAALAAKAGVAISVEMLVEGGARLANLLARQGMREIMLEGRWSAVILQDHSTTALHPAFRQDSATAIRYAAALAAPSPVLLMTPWARAEGHKLYRGAGVSSEGFEVPVGPADMTLRTARHFDTAAERAAIAGQAIVAVAPVARRWQGAIEEGRMLHARDGYHAAPEGADFTARILWEALAPLLR
ncbi:MAG: hypothetical protein AAGG47_01355 [Pseudomonadota bacterium]